MQNKEPEKIMIFVSTGRCGTVRLSQILKNRLPENFTVLHQTKISRLANIIGNILYYTRSDFNFIKKIIFRNLLKHNKSDFLINTDPLIAMMIPDDMIKSENVCIIHIYRKSADFAKSFYKFSRLKKKSFIAHNFIPFWQINIFPLQNWISGEKIIKRYEKTADIKNAWFIKKYKSNKHFDTVDMKTMFDSDFIEKKINSFFNTNFKINIEDLKIKANESEQK